ncbi:MAG: hypothetical protein H0U74_11700 [Bradymonadaceae bacterium]|nr:hypothetical protein [Lujinxingiaceae bacterium]
MTPRQFKKSLPWLELLWIFLILSSLGCAQSLPPDVLSERDVFELLDTSTAELPGQDTPDIAVEDIAQPDTRCTACCPGDRQCQSDSVRGICNASGTGFDEIACANGELCEDGNCSVAAVCHLGEKLCHDATTLLVCRATGTGFATHPCEQDSVCIVDQCVSGASNGTTCASAQDCAADKCRCGSDDTCPASWTPTYCTNSCVDQAGCTTSEWCMATAYHSAGHVYDHCVRRCDQACTLAGLECKHVPIHADGAIGWQQACVQKSLISVGEPCTSDAECVAGTCLLGYFNTGYCSRRCETGSCPSNAACVELRTGEYWCSLTCGDGALGGSAPCPLNVPDQRFDVTCKTKAVHGGGVSRVCSSTN